VALFDPEGFRAGPGDTAPVEGGRLELELSPYEVVRVDVGA